MPTRPSRHRHVLGLALLVAGCTDSEETAVEALQIEGVWVFAYGEPPQVSMDALGGGDATVVDGCLEVGEAVVVWHEHHVDAVEEVIARIAQAGTER
jgi:hypothetical protein